MTTKTVPTRRLRSALPSLGLVAGLAVIGLVAMPSVLSNVSAADHVDDKAAIDQLRHATDLSAAFRLAAKTAAPSVVHITSIDRVDVPANGGEGRRFWKDMFERGAEPDGEGRRGRSFRREGLGSGVVMRDTGHILTNNHVVSGADELLVRLQDGREYTAEIIGTDPETDLAVIKITADDLVPARFGDSDGLEVGEWVLAIGNPFGLDSTVTAGIVSAKGRNGMGLATFENFLQTDAAINPGNSGGPLINLHGEVVGINTAIQSRTGGSMGIGFAIPSRMAERVMDSLLDDGRVHRGWLGVSLQPLTPQRAANLGWNDSAGVIIANVLPDTPADAAGIMPGDILIRVNGTTVTSPDAVMKAVSEMLPSASARLGIVRDGESSELSVRLGERPTP